MMVLAALAEATPARAATYEIRPSDDLYARLRMLMPGDEVIIHEGTYPTPGFLELAWNGTESAPIVVRGADGEARPVIMGTPAQNTINLSGSWFTLAHVEITGGSHGIRLGSTDHATFDDLLIHDVADVGLSCNRPMTVCDSLTIRRTEIRHTGMAGSPGEGMYLGCNDAACVFSNSVIENNYIHDTDAGDQGDGIEIKTGSFGNVVRDNVVIRTRYPGITMYGFAAGEPNVVERNLVWHTMDNGIQVVGQVIVRNNIVVDSGANGIHSKASQGFVPNEAIIVNNTVVGAAVACVKTNDWATSSGQVMANNAAYCEGTTAVDINGGAMDARVVANIGLGGGAATTMGWSVGAGLVADLGMETMLARVYPPAASMLLDRGSAAEAPADDFDGTARSDGMPDVGAYERTAAGVGWVVVEGFRETRGTPGVDAGPGGSRDAGGGGDGGGVGDRDGGAGGSRDGGRGSADSDGCGCHTPGTAARESAAVTLLIATAYLLRRRRSR